MTSHKRILISRERLEDLLKSVGVVVVSETSTNLLCYCPFHDNRDSPAFNVSVNPPYLWKCWNGKCDERGNLISLLTKKGYTKDEAWKMVTSEVVDLGDFHEYLVGLLKEEEHINKWAGEDMFRFRKEDEEHGWPARTYLNERGIIDEAIEHFSIGYSARKDMVVIPVFSHRGIPVGIIGRSIKYKRYQYSNGMQRSELIWNLHDAKWGHDSIVLTEGALDAVYLWQAGVKNVGAVLGSSISPVQWRHIYEYFDSITCFFDNDEAGTSLTDTIFERVNDLDVFKVEYPDRLITYIDQNGEEKQRPIKDPGELTVDEIQHMMSMKKSKIQVLLGI